jgi:hypothetical protein
MRYLILAGESSTGKSTVGKAIQETLSDYGVSCRIDSLAAPLKSAVRAMLVGTRWHTPEMPEGCYGSASEFLTGRSELREATSPDVKGSIRDFCLAIGRAARVLDPNIYPKLLHARAEMAGGGGYTVTIVDDARFLNEIDAIYSTGSDYRIVRCYRDTAPPAPPDQDLLGANAEELVGRWDGVVTWGGYDMQIQQGRALGREFSTWARGLEGAL